jgi:hypothetical protein
MNPNDISTASLAALYASACTGDTPTTEQLVAEIDVRLHDGRDQEVRDFMAGCEERWLNRMDHVYGPDAPWLRDAGRWLAYARMTVPRGQVLGCPRDSFGSADMAAAVRALAAQWLEHARREGLPGYRGAGLVLNRLLPWFSYPGMPYDQVTATLDEALALCAQADFSKPAHYRAAWKWLIAELRTEDLVRYAAHGGRLFEDIMNHYRSERLPRLPRAQAAQAWKPWTAFFAEHPALYDGLYLDDLDLLAQRWTTADAERRLHLASMLLSQLGHARGAERSQAFQLFDRLAREDVAPFVQRLRDDGRYAINRPVAQHVMAHGPEALLPLLLPAIAESCDQEEEARRYRPQIRELVQRRPADLAAVAVKHLPDLLAQLDAVALKWALPVLTPVIAGSSAKALRAAVAAQAAQFSLADIVEAGWLRKPPKNLLLACRDLLLAHPDAAAAPLLAELLATGRLDAASASTVGQRLHQLGHMPGPAALADAPAHAPAAQPAPSGIAAQVQAVKRLSAAIRPFDRPELLALCQPLSEQAARVLLHLAAISEAGLPPLADQLMAAIPEEGRRRLVLALVEQWVAAEGDPKQRWALKLLPGHADDRVVDVLVAAVQAWNKTRLQRATVAVELLGEVDSLYALLRVQEISESRSLKEQVLRGARTALRAAARRRQMSVAELFDELTPDFGLAQGLDLVVGPQTFRVQLQGDLGLRVVNDKGRASKSLPAVKDPALQADWEAATARLKTLAASLRNVVKQQGPRMLAALVSGKRWPLERWQRLFVQHPLLRVVGRSLIWRAEDAPGLERPSFRLAEDFSLVDVEDGAVHLPAGCSISLWHPATALAGEREAWTAHLADYELDTLVDQLGACAELPAPAQFHKSSLLPPAPLSVAQEQLGGMLKKFGYRPGPVGDGPSINEHVWRLPALELAIELAHGHYPPYLDMGLPVELEGLRVRGQGSEGWEWRDPAQLPKPLLATLQGQWLALAAKAAA